MGDPSCNVVRIGVVGRVEDEEAVANVGVTGWGG